MVTVLGDLWKYDRRFATGIIVTALVFAFVPLSFVSPYPADQRGSLPRDLAPSVRYPLGTNSLGQDVFWTLTYAVRNSLVIGVLSAVLSRAVATAGGIASGYLGGVPDRVLSTLTESLIVIPRLPVLVLLSFVFKGRLTLLGIGLLLALLDWAWPSKRYRAQILSLKEREFTRTAVFCGMSGIKIAVKEHFPFLLPYLIADMISGFMWAIGMEITLAVLGLSDLLTPTIGTVIYWANYHQAMLRGLWWWITPPVLVSIMVILGFFLLSNSASEYLDPRTRLQRIVGKRQG